MIKSSVNKIIEIIWYGYQRFDLILFVLWTCWAIFFFALLSFCSSIMVN